MFPPASSASPNFGGMSTTTGTPSGATWGPFAQKQQPPNLVQKQYGTASAGTQQNISDYMTLSDAYKSAINNLTTGNFTFRPQTYQTPQPYNYNPDPALTGAVKNLQGLSQTGGYDSGTIADMRARGVAPIRAAYGNAMRQIGTAQRQEGGYSPNAIATIAKLAREQGQGMADAVQNVNAGIVAAQAQGKLGIAPVLAQTGKALSDAENEAQQRSIAERNQVNRANTDINNQATQFNLSFGPEQLTRLLSGATQLYGTTPALSRTFGDQALNTAQFQNQMNQQGINNTMNAVNTVKSGWR